AAPVSPAPTKPNLGWWLGGVAALSIGFYFGFTLTSVDAGGTPRTQTPDPSKTAETPVVRVNETKTPEPGGVVTIKPDTPPEPPKELVTRPEPPKRNDPPPPPEPAPPEPVSSRPKPSTKEPDQPPAEPNQDLERSVAADFDKACVSFKHGKYDAAKALLDGIQEKYRGTQWYSQNRALVDAGYARLAHSGKPWDTQFGAPAHPLDGPQGSRWELIYDQLTFDPSERQEWQLVPGTKVNWRPGSLTLTPSGAESCGVILSLDTQQVERLEAELEPGAGADYGWALFADQRSNVPVATCWYESDGTIHFWANEVEKSLSLREDPAKALRRVVVQFKGRKAWIDVNGKKEELNLNASPTGRYFPALMAAKAPVRFGTVRVHADFRADLPKLMQEEIERNARLKAEAPKRGLQKIKIVVASEHPAGVWVNDKRASPDTKGGFQPSTYLFSVPVGSVISVRQFPPQGKDGGPVLLDISPQDGSNKHAGTGITPNLWLASGELGNWMWEQKMHAGWQLADEKLVPDSAAKVPPGARAKYVMAANKSVLLHYVFDPADMK
ncbi:MAG: hypothetical protein KIS92_25665, partial [Planctomycetota bacterium]|nr:hypothetical protein [Planctomycetota bacterium]